MWNVKSKFTMSSIVLKWSPPLLGLNFSNVQTGDREVNQRVSGGAPALMTYKKTSPLGYTTRKVEGWELLLPRNVSLQFQLPGTTEECGNRIHGERLYVANIPKLSKCTNKQSMSWWHRNYEAETIIITHVCFCSPLTRDASTPKTPGQQQKK